MGYRVDEVLLPRIPDIKNDVYITRPRRSNLPSRIIASVRHGADIKAKLPIPDTSNADSMIYGLFKRSACTVPILDMNKMSRFKNFSNLFCKKFLTKIPRDTDVSVETWLKNTPYTQARKDELLEKYLKVRNRLDIKYFKVKAFVKHESYDKFKYPRGIYSRTDEFKCFVGPYFSLIDKIIFNLPWFIKKVPHALRPKLICDTLDMRASVFRASDYVSYEAHFRRIMFECCEWVIYEYLTSELPGASEFMWYVRNVIGNWNYIQFKEFEMLINATRMSGEMNTSSGNGLYNLLATMFLYYEKYGEAAFDLKIYVEGDDGVHRLLGNGIPASDYNSVGLTVEYIDSSSIMSLSFCGIVMDKEDLINVTNPMQYLVDFFWLNPKYFSARDHKKNELLLCKAYSALFQYPGCPIIYQLAKTVISLLPTQKDLLFDFSLFQDTYKYETFLINLSHYKNHTEQYNITVPVNTRLLVEQLYNITPHDQILIEDYLKNCTQLPIHIPDWFYTYINPIFLDYFDQFSIVHTINTDSQHPYVSFNKPTLSSMSFIKTDILNRTVDRQDFSNALHQNWFDKQNHEQFD